MAKETNIRPADEVEVIATSLIREFHPALREASIVYYLTTAPTKCCPQKPNPAMRYFASTHVEGVQKAEVAAGPDYIVWVNDLLWEFQVMRGKQQPFVDHYLEHMAVEVDGEGIPKFVLKGHSLEEHAEVLQRFGAWSDEAKQVRDILQPELDLGDATPMSLMPSLGGGLLDMAKKLRVWSHTVCVLAQKTYQPGDPAPEGYLAWDEWAAVQYKAGLRQVECGRCRRWQFPQELSALTDHATGNSATAVCLKCLTNGTGE